jgi:hypothetical protein
MNPEDRCSEGMAIGYARTGETLNGDDPLRGVSNFIPERSKTVISPRTGIR